MTHEEIVENLASKNMAVPSKYFTAWAAIHEGEITRHDEETGIGFIHDCEMSELNGVEKDLFARMQSVKLPPLPAGAVMVEFLVSEWSFTKHYYDDPSYCEMEIRVLNYETEKDAMEGDE